MSGCATAELSENVASILIHSRSGVCVYVWIECPRNLVVTSVVAITVFIERRARKRQFFFEEEKDRCM